ncbi:MAG: Fur family transcriptional regulator [Acidimicrobiales bacterium]
MDAAGAAGLTSAASLRAAGLRATRPRLSVLAALDRLGGHRSADDVAGTIAGAGGRLARMSVYNALDALARAGLVMRADAGPGRTLYEVAEHWHHHLVCRRCGAVIDVECVVGAKPCLTADLPGAVIDEAQVIFRGLCPTCAAV